MPLVPVYHKNKTLVIVSQSLNHVQSNPDIAPLFYHIFGDIMWIDGGVLRVVAN
jgi:hypothetical protein